MKFFWPVAIGAFIAGVVVTILARSIYGPMIWAIMKEPYLRWKDQRAEEREKKEKSDQAFKP